MYWKDMKEMVWDRKPCLYFTAPSTTRPTISEVLLESYSDLANHYIMLHRSILRTHISHLQ
jgi:hypothetical protein